MAKKQNAAEMVDFAAYARINEVTGCPYFVPRSKKNGTRMYLVTSSPLSAKRGAWRSVRVCVIADRTPRTRPQRRKGARK